MTRPFHILLQIETGKVTQRLRLLHIYPFQEAKLFTSYPQPVENFAVQHYTRGTNHYEFE